VTTKDAVVQFFSNLWRAPKKEGGVYWYPLNAKAIWSDVDFLESFLCVPELNAIINLKARCRSNGTLKIVNKSGKEIQSHKYNSLLKNPNWFQSQKEFIMQTTLFHEIYGNEYVYSLFPLGFDPTDRTKALFTLPPNLVECEYQETAPFFTFSEKPKGVKYILDNDGRKTELDSRSITHLNDNRVSIKKINDKYLLKGESKMLALKVAINNIRMAYESRGVIIRYRGAQGIVSPDGKDVSGPIMLSQDDKDAVQTAYRGYGTMLDQSQVIITSRPTKFQSMTVNDPRKLGLFDECEEDFYKMLDSYGMPPDLFSSSKGTTFTNKNEARKDIYENTIMPEANEWCQGLNAQLMADESAKIIPDFSHMPIFQEDLKVKSEAIAKKVEYLSALLQDKQITNEEYREELFKIGIGDGKPVPQQPKDESQNQNTNEQEETEE
jgi:hypothetical protein